MNNNIDLLLKITSKIICMEGRKTIGSGTGFFYRDEEKTYLVSNRHIFVSEEENFFPDKLCITLNKAVDDITSNGEISYDLYDKKTGKKLWLDLNRNIDIAALEIDDPKGYILAALTEGNLPPRSLKMTLGEQILVIGYPKGFYDDMHNLPIVRSATIASVYGIPFRGNDYFLVDSKLHPGTSGSPIITVPRNLIQNPTGGVSINSLPQWYFIGINSGEFGDLQLNLAWYSYLIPELVKKSSKKIMIKNKK